MLILPILNHCHGNCCNTHQYISFIQLGMGHSSNIYYDFVYFRHYQYCENRCRYLDNMAAKEAVAAQLHYSCNTLRATLTFIALLSWLTHTVVSINPNTIYLCRFYATIWHVAKYYGYFVNCKQFKPKLQIWFYISNKLTQNYIIVQITCGNTWLLIECHGIYTVNKQRCYYITKLYIYYIYVMEKVYCVIITTRGTASQCLLDCSRVK